MFSVGLKGGFWCLAALGVVQGSSGLGLREKLNFLHAGQTGVQLALLAFCRLRVVALFPKTYPKP